MCQLDALVNLSSTQAQVLSGGVSAIGFTSVVNDEVPKIYCVLIRRYIISVYL